MSSDKSASNLLLLIWLFADKEVVYHIALWVNRLGTVDIFVSRQKLPIHKTSAVLYFRRN